MPRPGSTVIHPGLAALVQAVDVAAMPDAGVLTRAHDAGTSYDHGTGLETPFTPTVVFTGSCRVDAAANRQVAVVGDDPTTLRLYDVALPVAVDDAEVDDVTGVQIDDIWTLTAGSPHLVGRPLRVVDITADTVEGERHLVCEEVLG